MENIKHFADAAAALVSLLVVVGGLWWKISRSYTKTELKLEQVEQGLRQLSSLVAELSKSSIAVITKIDEREKDTLRLEGAMEVQRRDLMAVISGLQQATSSLDSMWRTLQTLFPDRVPRRASDKG